jgi:hypothetical protein
VFKTHSGKRGLAIAVGLAALMMAGPTSATFAEEPSPKSDEAKLASQEARGAPAQLGRSVGRASTLSEENAARVAAGQSKAARLELDAKAAAKVSSAPQSAARVANSRFTAQSLGKLKNELAAKAGKPGVAYGFYYDERTDSVVVEGNLPRTQLPKQAVAKGLITYKHSTDVGRESRDNDSTPHWGGSAITRSGGVRCTSAFTVQTSTGARRAVTAGHCGTVGTVWNSGSYYFGNMTSRASFPTWDLALLSGSTYGSYIYMGGSTGVGTPTGAFGNPVVNVNYCTSGSTTYENCGKRVTSLSAQFCDASGCTPGLASYVGGTSTAGGDSGGPLVLKGSSVVYPRGVHIARSGSTMYAEKWSTVASYWGVTGVTSG